MIRHNNLGTISSGLDAGNNISLYNNAALNLGTISSAGTESFTSTGAITQSGTISGTTLTTSSVGGTPTGSRMVFSFRRAVLSQAHARGENTKPFLPPTKMAAPTENSADPGS